MLDRHGIYVLLDFHQDGWGPLTHGNGMPAWATLTDGLPNPPAEFPLYYVPNPALQRAFDNFWANRPGPDGVPLQDALRQGDARDREAVRAQPERHRLRSDERAVARRPTGRPASPAVPISSSNCSAPFYARMSEAVRSVDRRHPVYVEPFVLFNFGSAATSLPGAGSPNALVDPRLRGRRRRRISQ